MLKKLLIYFSLVLLFTVFSAFIYSFVLYKSENENLYSLITLAIGAGFFFLVGISTRFITNKKYLLFSLLIFIIVSLIIFIIKALALKQAPLLISYKLLINLLATILGSLLFKKRKV